MTIYINHDKKITENYILITIPMFMVIPLALFPALITPNNFIESDKQLLGISILITFFVGIFMSYLIYKFNKREIYIDINDSNFTVSEKSKTINTQDKTIMYGSYIGRKASARYTVKFKDKDSKQSISFTLTGGNLNRLKKFTQDIPDIKFEQKFLLI